MRAMAFGLTLLLAACGGGLSEDEAMELAKPKIAELSAAQKWTRVETIGPVKGEKGAKSVFLNAVVTGDGGEAEEYWRIDVTKACKLFSGSCETKTEVAQLDSKAFVTPTK